jgi:aryl-alcohol dehydrogenase-like predicted oxidoreductase
MTVETFELAPGYRISRLLKGGWQLAGGHGSVEAERAVADMAAFVEKGVTTFDCADIYTGVEELIGRARARMPAEALARMKVHTKLVPDLAMLPKLDKAHVEGIVDRSRRRLGMERLDLVQLHWWDYGVPGWLDVVGWLAELARAGKINRIGATNFDSLRTAQMLDAGLPLVSMQTQYSLLDARPENGLTAVCARTPLKLLCYGVLAGGFLSERWLGAAEPDDVSFNRSLVKYKLIIDDFGGWTLFQELLRALDGIARKHGVGIANVATRWVLDRPHVAGAIIGARYAANLDENLRVFAFALDDVDRAAIAEVLARRHGPQGDTYTLERDRKGRHGRIMKYNLNAE